jgi:hypothetical protein
MYPLHTGSILLDIANAQRNELVATSHTRRRAVIARRRSTTTPSTRPPKRPWWWGLAHSHRPA